MLPSSEMAAGVVSSKLAEPHVRLLISHLPGVLSCVDDDWVTRLLQVRPCGLCNIVPHSMHHAFRTLSLLLCLKWMALR